LKECYGLRTIASAESSEKMKKKSNTRQQKKDALNRENIEKIFKNNCEEVVDNAFVVAVGLALDAKYGTGGLYVREPITKEQVTAMRGAMAPLKAVLAYESSLSFLRIFAAFMADPQMRNFMRRKSAAALGKQGGRPKGLRAPYIEWLEQTMRANERRHSETVVRLSAKEHFNLILNHPEIETQDVDGNLVFTSHMLDGFAVKEGLKEPVITLSAVTETLTRIRKVK
jgi:hypothetical protein